MNGSLVPLLALVGGGALLYLGLRRNEKQKTSDAPEREHKVYCDVRSAQPCGAAGECIPVYAEGQAPPGYENAGLCFTEVPAP